MQGIALEKPAIVACQKVTKLMMKLQQFCCDFVMFSLLWFMQRFSFIVNGLTREAGPAGVGRSPLDDSTLGLGLELGSRLG